MSLWQREVFVRREHCEVLTRVLLQYRLLLRFSCSWSKLEAEICRIAVRNIVSAGRMLDARERGLGGRGGRRQAVSAAFIAFSNHAERPPGPAGCWLLVRLSPTPSVGRWEGASTAALQKSRPLIRTV